MKVRILIRQKVEGEAGTVCDVGPDRASFLLQCGAAEPVEETREQVETPEKAEVKIQVKPAAKPAKPAAKAQQKTVKKGK